MVDDEGTPENPNRKENENGDKGSGVFSPGFRSVAAMAGWDEEALLMASLVVEDTPDRKKRSDPLFKTPPIASIRKRRDLKKSPVSTPMVVLDLDEDKSSRQETVKVKEEKINANQDSKKEDEKSSELNSSKSSTIPCIDRLREELSCAICLEVCFEPSTTSCGHSFCKKCLRSAADKCGKRCPKCRQLISNGRSCSVNTVLWNTIQLLFPQEIEARKAAVAGGGGEDLQSPPPPRRRSQYRSVIAALNSPEGEQLSLERRRRTSSNTNHHHNLRTQSFRPASVVLLNSRDAGENSTSRRRRRREVAAPPPPRDEDAALALRLQREEFMGAFRGSEQPPVVMQQHNRRNSVSMATVNLRAMASRVIRGRPT